MKRIIEADTELTEDPDKQTSIGKSFLVGKAVLQLENRGTTAPGWTTNEGNY